jgi:hypothetical protein
MKKKLLLSLILVTNFVFSQDDLLSIVNEGNEKKHEKVFATFKTYKLGNAQTIETVKKNHLDFRISHRFGNVYNSALEPNALNEAAHTYFGFDNASDIRWSFDYGVTDNITIGIGRSRFRETYDGSLKWKILSQTQDFHIPLSIALFTDVGYTSVKSDQLYAGIVKDFNTNDLHRFNYFTQLIIASKLTNWLSLEFLPSYLHRNFIKQSINSSNKAEDTNGLFSLGFGARIKLTKRMCIIGDYFYNFSPYYQNNTSAFNPLALGFELETGGHVFSMFFTNAPALIENNFIPYTTDTWSKGQVKFGFCISRTFSL